MADPATTVRVDVAGRTLALSNLDKVLYPATETTKGEVLNYYMRVADLLLPLLAGRPVTRVRWPEGVGGISFFEKNLPSGAPGWLPRQVVSSTGSRRSSPEAVGHDTVTFPLVPDRAALAYLANLGSLELHVPQWRLDAEGEPRNPDRMVIDLDPGPGAGLRECSRVALLVRERLSAIGLVLVPVTSGSKGMQLYAALPGVHSSDDIRAVAQQLAQDLTAAHPDLVVWKMTKSLRPGKVLLDWSQNTAAKTTISPYSLRGRELPWVAAPRTWDEVEAGAATDGALDQLMLDDALARFDRLGDLAAGLRPADGPAGPAGPAPS
ncbi:MAG: non-homologous end-joining DNA ligase [Actinomycetales bacterium]|jgi:bifunctional non-homologous end joining protein LigD|nr:non-homologous end-joining DNA ligase [Candidatus Lutibacillus vidarii]